MEIQKKEIIIKPKRKKIDDSKNGDYFTFCRNKQCNQPLYKNRSNMDTRYCMECLQKGNMKSKYIKNNKDLLKFAQWCDEKIGMGFHWDNDFDEYIWNCFSNDKRKGKKMFTTKQSKILNQKLEECLNLNWRYFEEIIVSFMDDRRMKNMSEKQKDIYLNGEY